MKKNKDKDKVYINIISSFNHSNFVGLLKNSTSLNWEIKESDYNQVFQILTNSKSKIWKKKTNITLVWTNPENISGEFQKLLNRKSVNPKKIKHVI